MELCGGFLKFSYCDLAIQTCYHCDRSTKLILQPAHSLVMFLSSIWDFSFLSSIYHLILKFFCIGVLYRDAGSISLAIEAYEQCLKIDPDSRNAGQVISLNKYFLNSKCCCCWKLSMCIAWQMPHVILFFITLNYSVKLVYVCGWLYVM